MLSAGEYWLREPKFESLEKKLCRVVKLARGGKARAPRAILAQQLAPAALGQIAKSNFRSWERRNRPRDCDFRNLPQKL